MHKQRPATLRVAFVLLLIQAAALLAFAGAVTATSGDDGIVVTAFCTLVGAGVLVLAVGLWRLQRWSRGAGVAWSLLVFLIGCSQLGANLPTALAIASAGLGTAALLVWPTTRLALEGQTAESSDVQSMGTHQPESPEK